MTIKYPSSYKDQDQLLDKPFGDGRSSAPAFFQGLIHYRLRSLILPRRWMMFVGTGLATQREDLTHSKCMTVCSGYSEPIEAHCVL